MQIKIETVNGKTVIVDLGTVQNCFPDDDVIYFDDISPCKLSTARDPRVDELQAINAELLSALEWVIDSENSTLGDGGSILGDNPRANAIAAIKAAGGQVEPSDDYLEDLEEEE